MIEIYSAPNCPNCQTVKVWMKQNNIAFSEINVRENIEAANKLKVLGFRSIPQIFKDGEWVGDEKNYKEVLA